MNFFDTLIYRSLRICIRFSPILLWNIFLALRLFFSFDQNLVSIISIICAILLVVFILFSNSFIEIIYEIETSSFTLKRQIPTIKKAFADAGVNLIIVICLIPCYTIFLYIYGLIEIIYMYFDKSHLTIGERIIHNRTQNRMSE